MLSLPGVEGFGSSCTVSEKNDFDRSGDVVGDDHDVDDRFVKGHA